MEDNGGFFKPIKECIQDQQSLEEQTANVTCVSPFCFQECLDTVAAVSSTGKEFVQSSTKVLDFIIGHLVVGQSEFQLLVMLIQQGVGLDNEIQVLVGHLLLQRRTLLEDLPHRAELTCDWGVETPNIAVDRQTQNRNSLAVGADVEVGGGVLPISPDSIRRDVLGEIVGKVLSALHSPLWASKSSE